MGVPVASVAVGKCYLTEIGQVRRVLEIKEAMVKYESRGKTAHGPMRLRSTLSRRYPEPNR
jgi:hypothetical protein